MKNVVTRVLLFFLATPALLAIIVLFPEPNHLVWNLFVTLASGLAGMEVLSMFRASAFGARGRYPVAFAAGALLPAVATAAAVTKAAVSEAAYLLPAAAALFAAVVLGGAALGAREGEFARLLPSQAAYFFALAYPGLFATYGVLITMLPSASVLIVVFLLSVFLNDSLAYVTGMLFGRRSRAILAVSPNKSLAGFLGGFLASILVAVAARAFFPSVFPTGLTGAIVFGAALGAATILGDLAESALKRAAAIKDSGRLIPGRGGVLDSADSPLYVAPIFYYLYMIIFVG